MHAVPLRNLMIFWTNTSGLLQCDGTTLDTVIIDNMPHQPTPSPCQHDDSFTTPVPTIWLLLIILRIIRRGRGSMLQPLIITVVIPWWGTCTNDPDAATICLRKIWRDHDRFVFEKEVIDSKDGAMVTILVRKAGRIVLGWFQLWSVSTLPSSRNYNYSSLPNVH